MSQFTQFDTSEAEQFVESPAHQRNAPADKCDLQIAAVQAVIGYLPFDYVAGDEVTGLYMQKVIRKEWATLGVDACGYGPNSAEYTTKIHRKFDDGGTPYYESLSTSCNGIVRSRVVNDAGTETVYYNPDVYLEDQNDDGTPNPGNWGLNPNQTCIVWGGPLEDDHTDSRVETVTGYDVGDPPAARCGEGNGVSLVEDTTTATNRSQTIFVDDAGSPYDNLETSRLVETLSDWYPKETDWKATALELLAKRSFAPFVFTDINDDVQKRFGCGIGDTQRITLFWRRDQTHEYGVIEGEIPGTTASWSIAHQLELVDWEGGDPGDISGTASYISQSTGSPPGGIWCKKSRLFEPTCDVFNEQIYVGSNTGGHDAPACVDAGPFTGFHDFIPDVAVFGYNVTQDPLCSPPC